VGWSTEKGSIDRPLGFDVYSYSYRDKEGTKFHVSQGESYGESYGSGDVIGCYIQLPEKRTTATCIQFFRNGKSQGVAFSDLYKGNRFFLKQR
jgi:Set1/Ash2 histone methyltransferase complex subunit ASH2